MKTQNIIKIANIVTMIAMIVVAIAPIATSAQFDFDPPLRLEAGEGVVVQDSIVNQALDVTFEWREI